jgi:hypothetical protein
MAPTLTEGTGVGPPSPVLEFVVEDDAGASPEAVKEVIEEVGEPVVTEPVVTVTAPT